MVDLHFYGGLVLLALAAYLAAGTPLGLGVLGAGLLFVGIRG